MDYTTLVASKSTAGSLKNWINRDTIDAETVLTEAEALIWTTLRHWKMKAEATGTMTIGTASITLPTDLLDSRDLRITGIYSTRLKKGDERSVQNRYCYDGSGVRINQMPQWFYLSGLNAVFDNPADIAYPYLLSYYGRPAALSGTNTTNFLTTDAPRLLRSACMLIACEFEKEAGQGIYQPVYNSRYWQEQLDLQMGALQVMSDQADFARDAMPEFA